MNEIVVKASFVMVLAALSSSAVAADRTGASSMVPNALRGDGPVHVSRTITGRATVIDGRALWFPQSALKVQLAGIDSCELPQWSFDPMPHDDNRVLKPVPCGPLAKAWLKRTVGGAVVTCDVSTVVEGAFVGRCRAKGNDLAMEMLRVGWARVHGPSPAPPAYLAAQRASMAARYGMWGTYVLDMDEWRRKAVDQTLGRKPIADFNLLAEREREISPPFQDAVRHLVRPDR